jgi:inorganic pyrophosphatase
MPTSFGAHPWHGIAIGAEFPAMVRVYIETVPTDTVKYELNEESGILTIDNLQSASSVCPGLYGFVPRTYCGERVASLCPGATGAAPLVGDGHPLDICVLSERAAFSGDILLKAVPIGGLSLRDGGEVDDKLIAVLPEDTIHGGWHDIADCPAPLLDRLRHYFLDSEQTVGGEMRVREIAHDYGATHAQRIIRAGYADYLERFADVKEV